MCHCTAHGIHIVTRGIIIVLNHINAIDIGSRSYPTRSTRTGSLINFSMILDLVSFLLVTLSPSRSQRFRTVGFRSFHYLVVSSDNDNKSGVHSSDKKKWCNYYRRLNSYQWTPARWSEMRLQEYEYVRR